ncbi:MAG: histidine kinase [Ardenticatenaceae bacterium]|nr:histidine kinase [Ardenticatenaceae bacterium]
MPFLSQSGLQTRIMGYVTVGLVVIALVYTFVGLQAIQQSTEIVFQERLTMAQTAADQVDSLLEHVVEELESTATDVAPALETGDAPRAEVALSILYHHWIVYHHFSEPCTVSLVDAEGRVTWSEPARSDIVGTSVARLPGFQALAHAGFPTVTHSPSGVVLHHPVVSIAVPVRYDDRIAGYLIGEIEPAHASAQLVASLNIAGSGYVAELVDEDGEVLASTESSRRGKLSIYNRLFADRAQVRRADVRVHEVPGGGKHIVAYAPLNHVPWNVVVEKREDPALWLPQLLRIRLALFGLFALGAGLTTAWLTTRSVVRPVTQLIAATEQIASGDLEHPVVVQGQDEIGQLAAAFEGMRRDLAAGRRRVQDLAVLEERDRLAREMHDGFAQALSVLNLTARAARQAMLAGDTPQAAQALEALTQVVDQTYADVREAISGLRTPVSHKEGLIATVRQYLEEFELQYGITTEFEADGTTDLAFTATQEIQLLRIVQEALSNVRKHADAQRVRVRFQRVNDAIRITIADNGTGFDLAAVERSARRTFGLAIMQERAESLGGVLRLHSRAVAGTTVKVQIPLEQEGSDADGRPARPIG